MSDKDRTLDAVKQIDDMYSAQGIPSIGGFMNRIAATESNLGQDKLGSYSFSPFQMDDIRYQDVVNRTADSAPGQRRADIANKFLRQKLGRDDFDILDLNLKEEGHNPYIGAALTRMALAFNPNAIPEDLEGQANYWKKYWNSEAGAGTPAFFKEQVAAHDL